MDTLKAMRVFMVVVHRQGFAPAARELGMSTSAVSRWVVQLEDWLGVQLLHRTTRQLSLTQEGSYYLERIQSLVSGADELKGMAERRWREPEGILRVTAPPFVCRAWLQGILPAFLERYPKLTIDLFAVDRVVDLVSEGYDLAIRIGVLPDSSLMARRLADISLVLVASPDYLRQHGTPTHWKALQHHNCLVDTVAGYGNRWPFTEEGRHSTLAVSGNFRVNSGILCRELAVAGVGITLLPRFMVVEELAAGELVVLLEGAVDFEAGIHLVYPRRRHGSPALSCLMDYLASRIVEIRRA